MRGWVCASCSAEFPRTGPEVLHQGVTRCSQCVTVEVQQQEIERLKESALDHDCPTFPLCPAHADAWNPGDEPDCPYCEIERLKADANNLNSEVLREWTRAVIAEGEAERLRAQVTALGADRDRYKAEAERLKAMWGTLKDWAAHHPMSKPWTPQEMRTEASMYDVPDTLIESATVADMLRQGADTMEELATLRAKVTALEAERGWEAKR
jgi:hypothetical protein